MNKLAATTLESKFHVFDTRTQHPTKGFASVTEKVCMTNKFLFCIFKMHPLLNITVAFHVFVMSKLVS